MGHQASKKSSIFVESIALCAILLVATILRVYRLGYWGLEGDELNTLRDSLTMSSLTGPKPLLFFLNYHLLASWTTLNELSLRVFPAIFGVASVAVVYWFARCTINPRTALFAALLVAIDPTQLFWSQYARYYSLAYLLTVISALASYLALGTQKVRWYLVALLSLALAWLAHPSTGLVAAAIAGWFLWQLGSEHETERQNQKARTRRIQILVVLGVALAATLLWLPMLREWYYVGRGWRYNWLFLTLGHIDAVSPGIFACGLAGMWCLWRDGPHRVATMIVAIAFIPLLLALVLSNWFAVSHGYLFASTFVFPIGAAYLLDRLASDKPDKGLRRLAAAILLVLLLAEAAPKVWSQYCDGGRPDFRAGSRFVGERAREHDKVLTDQPPGVGHYLKDVAVSRLHRNPEKLAKMRRELYDASPNSRLWIITEFQSRGGFNDRNLGPATDWVIENCRLVASFAHSRLDYKHNEVRVYLVDPYADDHKDLPADASAD